MTGDACTSAGGRTMPQWEAERNVRGGHDGLLRAFVENNGKERFNLPVVKGSAPIAVFDRHWQGNATGDVDGATQNVRYCYGVRVSEANSWGQNGYSVQPAPRHR